MSTFPTQVPSACWVSTVEVKALPMVSTRKSRALGLFPCQRRTSVGLVGEVTTIAPSGRTIQEVLVDATGVVIVYSHRIYGKAAGPAMGEWVRANGAAIEQELMAWEGMPRVKALKRLPQGR